MAGHWDKTKWPDNTSFHIHSLLTLYLCFIVLYDTCCSHAQVFGKTLVHEFLIFYSHTEWNFLSSGTNALLWWSTGFTKLNNKQTNVQNITVTMRSNEHCNVFHLKYIFKKWFNSINYYNSKTNNRQNKKSSQNKLLEVSKETLEPISHYVDYWLSS